MQKLDMAMYAATQDNPAGPVYIMVDDDTLPLEPARGDDGHVSPAGRLAYALACAAIFGALAYMFLAL